MLKNDSKLQIDPTVDLKSTVIIKGSGNVIIEPYCVIEDYVLIDSGDCGLIRISSRSKLKQGSVIRAYDGFVDIGNRVTIGEYSILAGHGGITIGDAVVIAGHCYVTAQDHILTSNIPIRFQGETAQGIRIGFGSWIGGRCIIMDGVKIGDYCIVGAGSVVIKSLQGNMICYGTPCHEIRPRTENVEI